MRDAFGGIVNIATIVVFLVIVSGYLAFNVSYTKAFRVKNKIITTIEQYEGKCGTESGTSGGSCDTAIADYIKQLGYSPATFQVNDTGCSPIHQPTADDGYYIGKCVADKASSGSEEDNTKYYYKVETAIDISIPIINNILSNMKVFRLSGNTKLITEK